MTIEYKVRTTNSIKKDNDVICFDYIKELTSDYKATSLEKKFSNRKDGYICIFEDILKLLGATSKKKLLYFYGELAPWLDDTKVNRYKGFWGLKSYSCKNYSFLKEKKCVFKVKNGKIKLCGFSRLEFGYLSDMIMTTSYKDKSFYFLISDSGFDEDFFVSVIQEKSFGGVMDYILSQGSVVFILLGDEDFKSSEIVMIGDMINIIQ